MQKRLGCLSPVGLLSALITTISIIGYFLIRGGLMFSPGELSAAVGADRGGVQSHADIAGNCGACHAPFWSNETMATRCLDCHTEVRDQLNDIDQMHGALKAQQSGETFNCRSCHSEHKGAKAILTTVDETSFPHETTGFFLSGHGHHPNGREFRCQDCHTRTLTRMDPAICADCHGKQHPDFIAFHTDQFGADCLACHDGIDTFGTDFNHSDTRFPLLGRHEPLDCKACHAGNTTRADMTSTPTDCIACHQKDDAHHGEKGPDCAACHTADTWETEDD